MEDHRATAAIATGAEPTDQDRFGVLVAGGGVAALEAVLALAETAGDRVAIELLCPEEQFTLRALSVAQPFGGEQPRTIDLARFCDQHGARFRHDALAEVWSEQRRVLTAAADELTYDALLLALGARPVEALAGAHQFRGAADSGWYERLLGELEAGSIRRLAFVVPTGVQWALPLFELALLTSHWLAERGVSGVELVLVTHEASPLEVFGERISARIAALLARGGVELLTDRAVGAVAGGELLDEAGRALVAADEVVSLPALRVAEIPGIAQGRHGFIGCDAEMRVDGTVNVWVAGDASWFPIKQGGIAAQQAEVAAGWIAAAVGADVLPEPFCPVLRAALLTGEEPQFMRREIGAGSADAVTALAASPLWWPPGKVAGPRLAPYLAREWGGSLDDPTGRFADPEGRFEELHPVGQIEDLHPAESEGERDDEHRAALKLALNYARVDADEGQLDDALRWLDVAERLNVTLPTEYVERRRQWRERLAARGETGSARP